MLKTYIQCGEYSIGPRDMIVFNDLYIPCKEEVVIALFENDKADPDSFTIRVPCTNTGTIARDFKLAAYKATPERKKVTINPSEWDCNTSAADCKGKLIKMGVKAAIEIVKAGVEAIENNA